MIETLKPKQFFEGKLSEHAETDLMNITLPYVRKDVTLISPGVWNNNYYKLEVIKKAFEDTDWTNKDVCSLFNDHEDKKSKQWIGETKNHRYDGENVIADLYIVDMETARKLEYGAHFGISPTVVGKEEGGELLQFVFRNNSVVINPAVKTAYINNQEVSDLEEEIKKEEKKEDVVSEEATTETVETSVTESPEETVEEAKAEEAEAPAEETVKVEMSEKDAEVLSRVLKSVAVKKEDDVKALSDVDTTITDFVAFLQEYQEDHKTASIAEVAKVWGEKRAVLNSRFEMSQKIDAMSAEIKQLREDKPDAPARKTGQSFELSETQKKLSSNDLMGLALADGVDGA